MPEISREDIINAFEIFNNRRYPREFGTGGRAYFMRNTIVMSSEELLEEVSKFDYEDCYSSVFSFSKFERNEETRRGEWIRTTAIIDSIFIDIDSEDLYDAFLEARKLLRFFKKLDTKPYVQFSGSKGFHLKVFFEPVKLEYPEEAVKRVGTWLKETLKLQHLDLAVFDLARLSRLPFTINTKSERRVIPLDPELFSFDFHTVLHAIREGRYHLEDPEGSEFMREKMIREDRRVFYSSHLEGYRRASDNRRVERNSKGESWRQKYIKHYLEILKKFGRLEADPEIKRRHGNEHKARLWLACLLLEEGFSKEEIMEIFKLFNDFDPAITCYQIEHISRWLESRKTNSEPSRSSLTRGKEEEVVAK